jgi:hypothetical protein
VIAMRESRQSGSDVFEVVQGLEPIDPKVFEDFQKAMADDVIPDIVDVVEARRLLAAQTRQQQLKLYR